MAKLKGKGLKAVSALAAMVAALAFSAPSYAAAFNFNGKVHQIRAHNTAHINQGDWFTIVGLTSASPCATSGGFVIIKLPARNTVEYKEMRATLLAAKLSGRNVFGLFGDATLTDGFCTVSYLHLEQ